MAYNPSSPAAALPPGKTRNLDDPSNLKTLGLVTCFVFYPLATSVVACHAYTVFKLLRKICFEDVLLYIAWLGFSGFIGICVWTCFIPIGVHQWNFRLSQMQDLSYRVNILLILFGITITFLKAAITIKCLKVFVPQGRRNFMFWISWLIVWAHSLFYIIYCLLFIFACSPRSDIWDFSVPQADKKCIDMSALNITSGFMNTSTDIILLLLPHFVIWKLKMPLRRKKGLSILFALGVLVCAASICRLYYIMIYASSDDKSYYISIQGIVAIMELAAGCLIACLPLMPKFFASGLGIPLFMPVSRPGEGRAVGTFHHHRIRSKLFGSKYTRHEGASDKNLVPNPNTITVTQTYQVLFEDADPMTLRSSSGGTESHIMHPTSRVSVRHKGQTEHKDFRALRGV